MSETLSFLIFGRIGYFYFSLTHKAVFPMLHALKHAFYPDKRRYQALPTGSSEEMVLAAGTGSIDCSAGRCGQKMA
jgi:hypothetical protein